MYTPTFFLLALVALTFAAPQPQNEKRQQNLPELLSLASIAGITALPTDPAVLLSLGGVANQLASALPTSSVLSVLETAAPHSFISNVVNDPTYASSFESAFSAGSSPSWFTALPTDVKSYLHTYTGFGGLASAAAGLQNVTANATAMGNGTSATGTGGMTASLTSMTTTSNPSSSSGASAAGGSSSATSSKATTGGAVRPTGVLAVGAAGVVGVLGLAIAL